MSNVEWGKKAHTHAVQGVVFEYPECETKLAGERSGVQDEFPNTCPKCGACVQVWENIHDNGYEVNIVAGKPVREYIQKKYTEVKVSEG